MNHTSPVITRIVARVTVVGIVAVAMTGMLVKSGHELGMAFGDGRMES